jgi:hypothetical protein
MYLVSVNLIIREGEEYIRFLNSHFSEIEKKYKSTLKFEYFMYENDSRDRTEKEIRIFYENRSGKYLCEKVPNSKMMSGISIDRGTTMAKFRNKLKKHHGRLKSDFVLFINCDTIFLQSSIMSMINSLLADRNTSMVTGYPICYGSYFEENETNHYYDSLALVTKNNISYAQTGNSCVFSKCARCKIYRHINNINIPENELLDNKSVVNVKSAFGGFALIKTNVYNIVEWGESVCEHHSFCENVRKFGNIIIDPNIKFFTTSKRYSLKYKLIQRILANLVKNDKLVEKIKDDNIEYSSDDDEDKGEDEDEDKDEDSNIDKNIIKEPLIETNKEEERTIVISSIFENDVDDPVLQKSNAEKTKVVVKNSLFDQLYSINRFGDNEMQETILPVEEETLILIEDLDLNVEVENKKQDEIPQLIDLLDFCESKPEPKTTNFEKLSKFPTIHLTSPETIPTIHLTSPETLPTIHLICPEKLKIIPNLYEYVDQID